MALTNIDQGFAKARAVALQPDGKLVAAGSNVGSGRGAQGSEIALARYDIHGTLDGTFGTDGIVTTFFRLLQDAAYALAVQPDGKLVAAGSDDSGAEFDFELVRYNSDGSLDGDFGNGGEVRTDIASSEDIATGLVVQPDGKMIAAGSTAIGDFAGSDFALARYNPDGSLDATFGTGGKVTTDFAESYDKAAAVLLQPDGKIVVAGSSSRLLSFSTFGLARYNDDGTPDSSFGTAGKVTLRSGRSTVRRPPSRDKTMGSSWRQGSSSTATHIV